MRYLIVANQTLGGAELDRAIRDRIELGDAEFHVLVPKIAPHKEAGWNVADERFVPEGRDAESAAPDELTQADARSKHRLDQIIEKLRHKGVDASGTVGQSDPVRAVQEVLSEQSFDEVIVSTLPTGISRWLKVDLPSRIARMTGARVTHVVAEESRP